MDASRSGDNTPGGLREVAHIAWPIVVSMLSYTAMGVSDTLLVGWVGKTELAAVGLGTTAIFLVNSFFMGSLHGVKIISAQATGAGKGGVATSAAWHGMVLALVFGLAVVGLGFGGELIFRLMGGGPEVQALAAEYFGIRVLAAPFWYVTIALADHYQGTGDTRTPMKINLMANGVNIGLDIVFIFGLGPIPAMGVGGAALATVMASAAGMLVILLGFIRSRALPEQFDWAEIRDILRVGLPIGVHYVLGVAGFTVFTALLARMGEDELAAHQIAIKIVSLSFLPGYGMSEAASVLTGQYVGAGQPQHARRSFATAAWLSVAIMGIFGLVFWLVPEHLIRLFQDDQRVLEIGRQLLLVAAIFQIFDAIAMVATGALNGTGDTRFTMMASVAISWFVLVPAAWFFGVALGLGAMGAWMGMTFEIIILAAVMLYRFRSGAWQSKALVN